MKKLFILLAFSFSTASAFADMQPPVHAAQGGNFDTHKAAMLQRMEARKQAIQSHEDCLKAATNQEQAKACRQAAMATSGGREGDYRRMGGGMN
jgi:hypothetical protein